MNGTLSADILSFCERHGINVTEFGRLMGLPKQEIWHIKEGRQPDLQTLGEIRKLLARQVTTQTVREEVRMSRQNRHQRKSQAVAQANETRIIGQSNAGVSSNQIAAELGVGGRDVRRVLEREELIRQIQPTINASDLSLTDKEKLELAISQHKRRLDIEFEQRVAERTGTVTMPRTTAVPRTKIGPLVEAIENKSIIEAIRKWREDKHPSPEARADMAIELARPLVGTNFSAMFERHTENQRAAGNIISLGTPSRSRRR